MDGFDRVIVSDQGGGGGEAGFIHAITHTSVKLNRSLTNNSHIIKIPSRKGVKWEGDAWPLPARDLIDMESYHYFLKGERCTSIVSATGCPFGCTYCSHWDGYRQLEGKSAKRTEEEIELIKTQYGWRAVMFYDDEINLRPDFYDEFLPMLKRTGIIWRAFFKNGKNLTKESVFERMADAGCVQLCTGAESADPKVLKAVRKGATVEDNTKFIQYCVNHSIQPKVFTQVGLPHESPETVETLALWLEAMADLGLTDADVSITTPYEGTPIYDEPEKHAIHFNKELLDYSKDVVLYKGIPGEYKSHVWHDRLTADDLVTARQMVEDRFRRRAGLKPLMNNAKDDG
jgi:radical SAM superfamily enzyme YgiQ (UPF0313 family)